MLAWNFPSVTLTPAGNPRRRWLNRWWNRRRPGWRVAHRVRESEAVVARCLVAALDAERMVYHAALCFDAPSEWVRELQARLGSPFPDRRHPALDATVNAIPDGADSPSADCEATDKWFDIPQSA